MSLFLPCNPELQLPVNLPGLGEGVDGQAVAQAGFVPGADADGPGDQAALGPLIDFDYFLVRDENFPAPPAAQPHPCIGKLHVAGNLREVKNHQGQGGQEDQAQDGQGHDGLEFPGGFPGLIKIRGKAAGRLLFMGDSLLAAKERPGFPGGIIDGRKNGQDEAEPQGV